MHLNDKMLKHIIESINDGIFLLDENATIVYCNHYIERIFDCKKEELIGQNLFKFFVKNEDIANKYIEEHLKIFDSFDTEYPPFELEVGVKNEELIIFEFKATPIVYNNSNYGIYTIRNSSDKKLDEDSHKEYQEIFLKIVDTSRNAVIMIDNDAKVTYWNPSAERIFGYSSFEALNQKINELIITDLEQEEFERIFTKFKYTGKGFITDRTNEEPAIKKDGTEIVIETSVTTFKMGNSWSAILIIRDVTERKEADEILTNTIMKFENIFNAIDARIYIADEYYNITYLDKSLDRYEIKTDKKKKCYKYLWNLDSPCPWCKLKTVLNGQKIGFEMLNPENKKWYFVFNSPIEINKKKSMLSLVHDIQDIKKDFCII